MWRPRACAGASAANCTYPRIQSERTRDDAAYLVSVGLVHEALAMIVTAIAMFAATNIDDAVVLVVLNVASRAGGLPKRWEIWAGQYLGFSVLLLVSFLAALGLRVVRVEWVGLLGLIPVLLGIRGLVTFIR